MKPTKHETFKYFVYSDIEGGCEQDTGSFVSAFDTLDEAIVAIREKIEYICGDDQDAVSETIARIETFIPGNKPTVVYEDTLDNGGDEDDWLHEDFGIKYTNIWAEITVYEI